MEKGIATHSSILTWRIPRTEEPSGLQPVESQESDKFEQEQEHMILLIINIYLLLLLLSHFGLFVTSWMAMGGSSDRGILQVRILEWVAIPFSMGSSRPRNRTCVSCLAGRFFTTEPPGKTDS